MTGFPNAIENQKKGVIARKENKERQTDILINAIFGGFEGYKELLESLYKTDDKGFKLTENQKIYMEKIEKMAEFAIPKRAREDGKGNADVGTNNVYISEEHRAKAKEAIQNYLNK